MPLVNLDSQTEPPVSPNVVNLEEKTYTHNDFKTSTLFSKDVELDSILNYISGMQWEVTYFKQALNINDEPSYPDINVPATLLSYDKIEKLVLHVQDGINQSNLNDITGTAVISAGFVPNIGDAFIATVTGGMEVIFVIDKVDKKIYNQHEIYDVSFKLYTTLTSNSVEYRDLINKVVRRYVYDASYVTTKSAPLLLKKDYLDKVYLVNELTKISNFYLNKFISKEKGMLLLPTKLEKQYLYDQNVSDTIFKLFSLNMSPSLAEISRISLDDYDSSYNIYDVLLTRDVGTLKLADPELSFIPVTNIYTSPVIRKLYYLNIDYMVGNTTTVKTFDIVQNPLQNSRSDVLVSNSTMKYVFTTNFYQQLDDLGVFEKAVMDYLNNTDVAYDTLDTFIDDYMYWSTEQQFYYLPILYLLIKNKTNNTFSLI